MSHNFDICVIGAGAAGLSVASGASQLGVKVALIEGHLMGGDCLNYGCVPSKALLSASKHFYQIKHSEQYGFSATTTPADIPNILKQVKQVINTIAPNDSVERFTKLGVTVYNGWASFIDADTIKVNEDTIKAKYFVIATGARASLPPIPGLNTVQYYTNETIFDLPETPTHLIVIGGGPIGCEIAQSMLMLGVKVTIIARDTLLPKDETDLIQILRQQMLQQGLKLYEETGINTIHKTSTGIAVDINYQGELITVDGSHLLIATGRTPNLEKLNLQNANVNFTKFGIKADERLRTSNKKIFALGDIIEGYKFTHIAGYQAGIVIRNILFRQSAKVNYTAMPWVTYTYPELAHVGLSVSEARAKYKGIKITEHHYADNDRAVAERETTGKIQLITTNKGKILGVSIIGLNAGEILAPWIDLINRGESVKAITNNIIPYPTLSEINKQVVSKYYAPILFSGKVKFLVKILKIFW